jgi:uncharacterized repeat protein (TIGR01451 family)
VTPDTASPGDVVTYTLVVSNGGPSPAQDLLLRDDLPQGLHYLDGSAPGADYDRRDQTLTWHLSVLDAGQEVVVSLAARVTGPPDRLVTNVAALAAGDDTEPLTATATLQIQKPPALGQARISPQRGGQLVSANGRVRVHFPPGAVRKSALATVREARRLDGDLPDEPFYQFELEAQEETSARAMTSFERPLTVTLTYTEGQVAGLNEDSLRLVYWDDAQGKWVPLPSQVDAVRNVISARVDHFSLYGGYGDPAALVAETFESFQTDLFAGSASYALNLEVPSGPSGLAPALTLSYNSGAVNAMLSDGSPGTWVGAGWSLDLGYIAYSKGADEYSLVLNGASYKLKEHDSQNHLYHTVPESFLKIQKTGNGWNVWGKDGTVYRFGRFARQPDTRYGGTYGASRLFYVDADQSGNCQDRPVRWYLDEMMDTHHNVVGIVYQVPSIGHYANCTGQDKDYPREVYPYKIFYSTNATAGDNTAEYEIVFTLDERYNAGVDPHIGDAKN